MDAMGAKAHLLLTHKNMKTDGAINDEIVADLKQFICDNVASGIGDRALQVYVWVRDGTITHGAAEILLVDIKTDLANGTNLDL